MRILMVTTNPAFVEVSGGTTVSRMKLVELLELKNKVFFLTARRASGRSMIASSAGPNNQFSFIQVFLAGKCLSMLTDLNPFYFISLEKLRTLSIQLVVVTEPFGAIAARFALPNVPIVYDAHDVAGDHARLGWNRAKMDFPLLRSRLLDVLFGSLFVGWIRLIEKSTCRLSSKIIAISDLDRLRLATEYNVSPNRVFAIPPWTRASLVLPAHRMQSANRGEIRVLFHGGYRHMANYEAFKLIEDYIAPETWKRDKSIKFILAGTGLPSYEAGNIISLGYVSDLRGLLHGCDFAIAPVISGTGVRIKVFDYMEAGLPIISTAKAVEGIDVENGVHAIVLGQVDNRFIDAIVDLANNEQKRVELATNGLALMRSRYDWDIAKARVESFLKSIGS